MSIRTKSPTKWERTYAAGNYNESYDIEANAEGLEIDYDMLTWEQIDAARIALGSPDVDYAGAFDPEGFAASVAELKRDAARYRWIAAHGGPFAETDSAWDSKANLDAEVDRCAAYDADKA